MDLLTQLNTAMAYIEAHIDDDLALADAVRAGHISRDDAFTYCVNAEVLGKYI